MIEEIKTTVESYNAIAEKYCEHTLNEQIRKYEKKLVDSFLEVIDSKSPLIMDIGCGDGRDTKYMHDRKVKVISCDLSMKMMDITRRNVPEAPLLLLDAMHMPVKEDIIDGIWMSGVIYHFPKREVHLPIREIYRVLKKGGIFSLNFKTGSGEGMEENPRSFPGAPRYFAYYGPGEMIDYLSRFVVLEVEQYPGKIYQDTIMHLWLRKE